MNLLPNRLRNRRKAAGLTQRDLAKLCDMEQSHLSRLERGETGASLDLLRRLAQHLKTTVSELIGEDLGNLQEPAQTTKARTAIAADPDLPNGLRELADDSALAEALRITPEEWHILKSIPLRNTVTRDGYVQLLITIRAINT